MKTLQFIFTDKDILTEVTKRTSYLGKSRGTETQMHLLDRLSLTEGENFLFNELLEDAITEVYDWVKAFGRDIPLSVWHKNADLITEPTEDMDIVRGSVVSADDKYYLTFANCKGDSYKSFSYQLDEDPRGTIRFILRQTCHFDMNMLDSIDRYLRTALVDYIIYRWFEYVFPDESVRFFNDFEDNAQKAKNALDSEDDVMERRYHLF